MTQIIIEPINYFNKIVSPDNSQLNYLPTIEKIFTAFFIIAGIWLLSKYCWMVIYQWRYGNNYGDLYLKNKLSKEDKQNLKKNYSLFKWRNKYDRK